MGAAVVLHACACRVWAQWAVPGDCRALPGHQCTTDPETPADAAVPHSAGLIPRKTDMLCASPHGRAHGAVAVSGGAGATCDIFMCTEACILFILIDFL